MNKMKRKPLKAQALVYDTDCPMCCTYTKAFINAGILEEKGRIPYKETAFCSPEWDAKRAKNEIALVNYENGHVTYGIDSMFAVISHRFSFLKPLFEIKSFGWFMKRFYRFISFNRKVIAPPPVNTTEPACIPDVNLFYRWMYILFALVISAVILSRFTPILHDFIGNGNLWREVQICGGQLVFQVGILACLGKLKETMDYLGNLMTVSLEGALFLLPVITINRLMNLPQVISLFYFLLVVCFMFFIHYRRVKSLNLSFLLCITWLVYRGVVLLLILI